MENPFTEIQLPPIADNNQLAALLLNNLPDSVLLVDKALKIVTCNATAKEIVHRYFKKEIYAGLPLFDLIKPQRHAMLLNILRDVLSGKTCTMENSPTLKGKEIYENNFLPARNNDGEIVGILIRSSNVTERKAAERAVQKAEERWQFAFEASNQAAWDWNMQTNEVIYSSSYKKLYGFLNSDLKNHLSEWQTRIHPEDKGRVEKAVQEHTQSGNPYYETTYRIQLKNGDYKWIMARGKLLSKDGAGQPLRMIGTHTDLTATMQRKAEMKKMNERFHYAVKALSQAVWEWDAISGEAYVSPSFTEMFGWKADENNSFDQWHHYVHPDDRKETVDHYYNTLKNTDKNTWEASYRFLKADGSYAWVRDKAYIIRDAANSVVKVIGATEDITSLKNAETELLKSNQRFDIVMKATNELVWEWDFGTGKIYRAEEGVRNVYGVHDHSTVETAEQWFQRVHPDDLERTHRQMEAIMRGKHLQVFETDYRFRRDDGNYNDIHSRGILLKDENDKPVYLIGSEQNITERKSFERELLQNELEMKKRINQASVDSQEQERSEIARELHDNINQVLTTTKLYLELASTNAEIADELMKKSRENIGSVIHEIRQLSRSLMDPTIGDLGIVNSINDLVEDLNITKKLHISLDVDEAIENLLERKQKLTIFRILQESLNNVVKHACATTVFVSIRQDNNAVMFEVKDNGIGFIPESVKKGAGLKNITNRIYLINGQFILESNPGKGCTIKINFPI